MHFIDLQNLLNLRRPKTSPCFLVFSPLATLLLIPWKSKYEIPIFDFQHRLFIFKKYLLTKMRRIKNTNLLFWINENANKSILYYIVISNSCNAVSWKLPLDLTCTMHLHTSKYIMIKRPEGRCVIFAKLSHYIYLSPTTFGIAIFFFLLPKIGIQNNPAISFPIFKGNVFSIFGDARNSVVGCLLHWICIISLILFLVPWKFAPKKKSEPRDEAFISLKKKISSPENIPS